MITVRVTGTEVIERMRALARRGLPQAIDQTVRDGGQIVLSDMRVRLSYPRGSYLERAPRGHLGYRSRELVESLRVDYARAVNGTLTATIGPTGARNMMKAIVNERGATLRSRTGRYLKVPLPPALDSRGLPRPGLDESNTFVFRSRRGNLIVARREGRGLTPLYVLKESVRIPARRMFATETEAARSVIVQMFNARVASLVRF